MSVFFCRSIGLDGRTTDSARVAFRVRFAGIAGVRGKAVAFAKMKE